ncbi:MAG: CarD family transcriptional regulator [Clostridiaceae bacterium]|nr:CarD family transcriptional regulator [Clostridiaceae bacterium]
MFSVGDKIAHPMHGAGIIKGVTTQRIDGENRDYFEVEMVAGTMTVMIPCGNNSVAGIRPIIIPDMVNEVLAKLLEEQEADDFNWNKRYRENMIKIKSGDLIQVAGVIKALVLRERERGLSTGERKMLTSAKQIVVSEIALAKDISYKEAENIVNERLI